jgi:hypothetical protein
MKNVVNFALLTFLITQATSYSRVQFYVGVAITQNTTNHDVSHDMASWNKHLTEKYEVYLKRVYDELLYQTTHGGKANLTSLSAGTPQEIFEHLLNDSSPNVFKKKAKTTSVNATIGAFVYRHKAILLAVEAYAGGDGASENHKAEIFVLKSNVPSQVKNSTYTAIDAGDFAPKYEVTVFKSTINNISQLNPVKYPLVPYSYIGGECRLENEVCINPHFRTGLTFRMGTILADRLYIFATFGADIARRSIKVVSTPKGIEDMFFYTCHPTVGDTDITFYRFVLSPKDSGTRVTFDKHKNIIGVIGGGGVEVFITRGLSARFDASYKHAADVRIKSTDQSAELQYRSSHWRFSGGMFYRF